MEYDTRHGRTFAVMELEDKCKPKRKRRQFEPKWVKLPRHWITSLRSSKSAKNWHISFSGKPSNANMWVERSFYPLR
jgi:hypothetical protein